MRAEAWVVDAIDMYGPPDMYFIADDGTEAFAWTKRRGDMLHYLIVAMPGVPVTTSQWHTAHYSEWREHTRQDEDLAKWARNKLCDEELIEREVARAEAADKREHMLMLQSRPPLPERTSPEWIRRRPPFHLPRAGRR